MTHAERPPTASSGQGAPGAAQQGKEASGSAELPDSRGRGATGTAWWRELSGAWAGLVKGLAAVGGFAATYDLAKALGQGDSAWQWELLASVIAFGVGVVLLLAVSVMLSMSNREWMSDLVWRVHRRKIRRAEWQLGPGRDLVDRETLLGHEDPKEFQQHLLSILTHVRKRWEDGEKPLPHETQLLEVYQLQREAMLEEQARRKVHSASNRATLIAVLGVVLAIGGYANAWYLTNLDVRKAELADAESAHLRSMEVQVLEAALARPDAQPLVPQLQSDVVFTVPDRDTAAEVVGPDAVATPSCWQQRSSIALDWGNGGQAPAGRDLLVAYVATEDCAAGSTWIDPAWLGTGPASDDFDDAQPGATDAPSPAATPTGPPATTATATASPEPA